MISPEVHHQFISRMLKTFNNCLINGILVLFKPTSNIISNSTSIMNTGKMSIRISSRSGLCKARKLAQGGFQLFLKRFVSTFLYIFLLFNNKHVVVEELLELLIDKVDGDLLKAVVLEDLKAGNVEHSTEVGLLHGGVN